MKVVRTVLRGGSGTYLKLAPLPDRKGIDYQEYVIDGDEDARDEMAMRANGRRSLPQIFINNHHVGGCDDLFALDAQDGIEPLLEMSPVS